MKDSISTITYSIINEDGTEFKPPMITEYKELFKKYPICKFKGYNCMFCSDCMCGEYFKPMDENEEDIIIRQNDAVLAYLFMHNPSIKEKKKEVT